MLIQNRAFGLIFIVFLISCSKEKNTKIAKIVKNDPIIVNIDKVSNKRIVIDTLIDNNSIEFIPLETNKKSLFGFVNKIFLINSTFFIYDKGLKRILEFKKNGDYVKNIGDYGKGPMEYDDVRGIQYNKYKNTIDIMDVHRRLIQNDIVSGKAIDEIKLVFDEFSVDCFYPIEKDAYTLYNNFRLDIKSDHDEFYRFAYLKNNGFMYKSLPYPYIPNKRVYPILVDDMFYPYQNKIRFFESFNSMIYTVTNNGLQLKYKIVYESMGNEEDDLEKEVKDILYPSNDKKSITLNKVLESKRYLFTGFIESEKGTDIAYRRYALYDKVNKKCLGNSIKPYMIQELLLDVFLKQLSNELFVAEIPPSVILMHQKLIKENLKPEEYTPLMKKLMKLNVKEIDNSVLMLMKMK